MNLLIVLTLLLATALGPLGQGFGVIANKLSQITPAQAKSHSVALRPNALMPKPTIKPNMKPLAISAQAGMIMDPATSEVIVEKSGHEQLAPASLTKLMTALVIMDRHKPDEIVEVENQFSSTQADAQKVGLKVGQKFRLSDLMQMLLVYSANDAAEALAVYDAGSVEAFVNRMNEYSAKLGLDDSHFENPTGLDATNHYSSAADLASMARILLHNQSFRTIVRQPRGVVQSLGGTNFSFASTNQLLAYPYIIGLKTGKTEQAGECLVTLSAKDGHELITVVLNSPNRFQESKNMVDWAFANTIWK